MSFEKSPFYNVIKNQETIRFQNLVNDSDTKLTEIKLLNHADKSGTYLHLAIASRCDAEVIAGLITHGVPISHRNTERQNFMDVMLETNYPFALQVSTFVCSYVMDAMKEGTVDVIRELTRDMWTHWPIRGIPEIDRLTEAPEYLSQIVVPELSAHSFGLDMFKPDRDLNFDSVHQTKLNAFKMTFEHVWAIINPKTLTERKIQDMDELTGPDESERLNSYTEELERKDVMDRLAFHYLCSQDLKDDSDNIKEIVCSLGFDKHKDKRGFTPLDYLEKKASINIEGIRKLILYTERASVFLDNAENVFTHLESGKGERFAETYDTEELWQTTFKDATGRNMTHKAVIYDCQDLLDIILRHDTKGEARTSKDAWGRTPYHYAYMFNNKRAINSLNIIKKKKDKDYVKEGKCRDFEGKRIEDLHITAADAQETRKQLVESMNMMHNFHLLITWAYTLDDSEFGQKLYWVRDIGTGFTQAHSVVLNGEPSDMTAIKKDSPQSFNSDVTDVFGNTALDYLTLSGSDHQARVDEFFKELENDQPKLTVKPHLNLITREMIDKQLRRDKINNTYYKVHTISNPNRPKTGHFEEVLKEKLKAQSTKQPHTGQAKLRPLPTLCETAGDDTPFDAQYLKRTLGETLMAGLSVIAQTNPTDPIEYLAKYLYKHAKNVAFQKQVEVEKRLLEIEKQTAECEESRRQVLESEQQNLHKQLNSSAIQPQTTTTGIPVIKETDEN